MPAFFELGDQANFLKSGNSSEGKNVILHEPTILDYSILILLEGPLEVDY